MLAKQISIFRSIRKIETRFAIFVEDNKLNPAKTQKAMSASPWNAPTPPPEP